ncbi:phosphate regulon transcriptional regulator PhoB [Thiohalophilus thiocyanatoxydans]|uniref:Phosphate regulon transcriptional regulatory protein PhoB n=1 Tax=Thiohalophilus thiocyanatoxydans TaxID=381308 RepID=A0A4R8IFQ5_9GAMM|nr:phosphate regulon transcriptional regulator PhoB [Thiohalophilus thiocyanatoxydans]TDX99360.1 two-component system phosphate regulon response regulator PhoB [Thiohalophilus thiocyanatoxydans]
MSQAITLLVVEDEAAIREMLEFTLVRAGFRVIEAADAREAGERLAGEKPDLVLLDWMLPGISGVEFAKRLRRDEATRDLPVIMLTARDEEESKLRGYEAGIDDYVTKPFSNQELIARIRAVLRRSRGPESSEIIEIAGLSLDSAGHRVSIQGQPVNLGPTEFRLLHFFMTHAERVYSRDQLLDQVWGDQVYIEDRTVDVHIRRLRKALAPYGFDRHVQTVRGAGYRFSKQV